MCYHKESTDSVQSPSKFQGHSTREDNPEIYRETQKTKNTQNISKKRRGNITGAITFTNLKLLGQKCKTKTNKNPNKK